MPRTVNDLYQEALQLTEAERCQLADLLEASMDPAAIEQSWLDEASRRLDAIERGNAKIVDWGEVKLGLERKKRP